MVLSTAPDFPIQPEMKGFKVRGAGSFRRKWSLQNVLDIDFCLLLAWKNTSLIAV